MPLPKRLIGLLSASALLAACSPGHVGDGDAKTQERSVGPFSQVVNASPLDVELTADAGAEAKLTVTCDGNLHEFIETALDGDVLSIKVGGRLKAKTRCVVEAAVPELSAVEVDGSGDLQVTGPAPKLSALATRGSGDLFAEQLSAPKIRASTSGSGSLKLGGTTDQVELSSSGSGDIEARALESRTAQASTSGSGAIELTVTETIEGQTSGSGDIVVYGDPSGRTVASSGSGEVIFR